MSAKQFRLANGIEKGKSIRPYLTKEQIDMLEILQKVDVGLLVAFPDYEERMTMKVIHLNMMDQCAKINMARLFRSL